MADKSNLNVSRHSYRSNQSLQRPKLRDNLSVNTQREWQRGEDAENDVMGTKATQAERRTTTRMTAEVTTKETREALQVTAGPNTANTGARQLLMTWDTMKDPQRCGELSRPVLTHNKFKAS